MRRITIDVEAQIQTNGLVGEIPVKIAALPTDARVNGLKLEVGLTQEPSLLVVLQKKTLKLVSETKEAIVMKGELVLEVAELPKPVLPEAISKATLKKKTLALTLGLKGAVAQTGTVEATITDAKTPFRAELKASYPSEKVTLTLVKNVPTLTLDLRGSVTEKLGKNLVLNLKLGSPLAIQGEILNAVKPVTERVLDNVKVKVK